MANADSPKGLVPTKHRNGAPYNGSVNFYYIPVTEANALFIGDPVIITGTSNTTDIDGYQPATLPAVTKASFGATNRISGVIQGFVADPDTNLSRIYNPATTERVVMVADDPDLVFELQDDGSATLAATDVGFNANLVDGTGSTVTGLSGVELDATTPAADATFQLNIERLINKQDNALGVNAKWEVSINLHTQSNGVGTAGV